MVYHTPHSEVSGDGNLLMSSSEVLAMSKDPDDKNPEEIMKRMLQMPHKPHAAKKKAKKKPAEKQASASV